LAHNYPTDLRGKLLFIVNPVAGNGRGRRVWHILETILKRDNFPHEVCMTSKPGGATELASQLAAREPLAMVAVGGDGTLHEVAQGLSIQTLRCPLAYIPAGSGNDFARALRIPFDPEEALTRLMERFRTAQSDGEQCSPIDMLRFGDIWAVNSLGAGLDGYVIKLTIEAKYKRWLNRIGLGSLVYPLTLVRALFTYRPGTAVVTVDGRQMTFNKLWFCAVTNISYFGGGMHIVPDAKPDDGYADICIVSGISRLGLLLAFPRVYKGRHTNLKAASFLRGRSVRIESDKPLTLQADGEYAGETPAIIELVPEHLQIVRLNGG
jgi:YegS/Rv2252/BmrU family lipid kinase